MGEIIQGADFCRKVMASVFWDGEGTSLVELLERDATNNSQRHVEQALTLILRRSRTGTVWFYTSTSNKRAARPKLYTKSLTRDLRMYSRFTLVRISINL